MDNQTNPITEPKKENSTIPEPPALEIDIRTMESDIKAFKEGGGETPTSGTQEKFVSQRPDDMQKTTAGAPAYTGPEKPLFETPVVAQRPVVTTPSSQQTSSTGTVKVLLITAGIIIAVIGLGLLGYFIVFPYVFNLIGK